MPNSSNIQIAATRPLLFTKTCLALRMMLERKLYFIWTSLSFSLSESRGCTELAGTPETWLPTPVRVSISAYQQKGLAGLMQIKVRKHELSLSSVTQPVNKGLQYSLPSFISGMKSTNMTEHKRKQLVKWSFAYAPPDMQFQSTIKRYIFSAVGI